MFIVLAYIKFLFRSTNQHGVHSPFVYNLVTKCFYDRKKYPAYTILRDYRKSLLKDKRKIQIKDFGAGSRVFTSDEREVSKMAKTSGISPKRARLLNRLVRYLEVKSALELGTSLGMGTAAMAAGNKVKITTIEGCPETAKVAEEKFKEFGFDDVELKVERFKEYLVDSGQRKEDGRIQNSKFKIQDSKTIDPELKTENRKLRTENRQPATGNWQQERNSKSQIPNSKFSRTDNQQIRSSNPEPPIDNSQLTSLNSELLTYNYDLLYIDGNHQKKATLSYFEALLPTIHNESIIIFDDIHWSKAMEEAWEEIKLHPRVTVTIDTFQWGLVFFRREQEKEHFIIRV